MKIKGIFILVLLVVVMSSYCYADYFYTPFNFEDQDNHTFDISLEGNIEVILPNNFTLVSGSLIGVNSTSFVMRSPNITGDTPQLFTGTINVNGSFYENYHLLYTPMNKIVDTKLEIGHGDFNYIDSNSAISDDNTLLFNLIRVWAIGSDIIGEPANNVRFNCTFPLIIPNSVDGKYTTEYGTDILATGELPTMEGMSLFRIFVLSQEVNQEIGTNYEVNCDTLYYNFTHTEVIADIEDINISIRGTEPLQITKTDNNEYVTYSIYNNEQYDLRDLEFLFEIGTDTIRKELNSLDSGELYSFNIPTNESGTIDLKARFIPEWMFNSRSPVYYEQTTFENYYTPTVLNALNSSLYYDNQNILADNAVSGIPLEFDIEILQEPPFGGDYQIEYDFYNENDVLVYTKTETISGTTGVKEISFDSRDIPINGAEEDFDVKTTVSIIDDEGNTFSFESVDIGTQQIKALTKSINTEPINVLSVPEEPTQTEVNTESNKVTGFSVIEDVKSGDFNPWAYIIGSLIFLGLLLIFFASGTKTKRKRKEYQTSRMQRS